MTRAALAFAAEVGHSSPVDAIRSMLLGLRTMETSDEWAETRPYRFDLATSGWLAGVVKAWKAEKVIPDGLFDLLPPDMQIRAGSLAHQWDRAFVSELYDSLAKSAMRGDTLREWTKKAQRIVDKYGAAENAPRLFPDGKFSPWYSDVVYRTNMTALQKGGLYAEMFSRKGIGIAPYWLFSAIHDGRSCPGGICAALDGKLFSKADMAARHLLSPLHFQCRCSCIEIDQQAAEDGGYVVWSGAAMRKTGIVIPEGWDVNRVDALVPSYLRGANLDPEVVN